MPAAAGVWLANIAIGMASAGAILSSGLAIANVAYAVGYAVGALALSAGLAKVSAALQGRPKLGGGLQSRKVTLRSSTEYRTVLYGTGRTGGVLVYANTSGTKNEHLDFVVAVAGHQIDAITDVWFDDVKIAEADINSGAAAGGAVGGSGQYRPRGGNTVVWIYKYLGTDTQTASSTLDTAYTEWTSDHRLRGCAYVHIRLRRNSDAFEQGAPGNFSFGYRGALVYDPRLDTTAGGSGAHRVSDPSTWAYSNNWALCVADYLIGGTLTNSATRVNWRGFGADPADVSWASVIAAANIADENVTIPGSTTQKRYTADGALSTGAIPADNLEQLLTAGLGQLTYASDGYRLYAGAFQTATLSLAEADLAGEVACTADTPRADRYNAVKGTRWDRETGQEVEFLPRTSPTYETEDGAQLFREIELPFTSDEYRAQRIAQIILRRSREQETLVMHCNPGALRVGVWETASVTLAELGISSKTYRCLSRDEHEDDSVTLTLREEYSTTYTDPAVEDYGSLTPANPQPIPPDIRYEDSSPPIQDPYFQFSAENKVYWDWGSATGVALSMTGGVTGGICTLTGNSTSKYVYSSREPMLPVVTGQQFRLYIRYRRTSSIGGTDTLYIGGISSNGQPPDEEINGSAGLGGLDITGVNTKTVNEWQEADVLLTVTNLPKNQTQHKYGFFYVALLSATTSGTIEVDTLIAVPV